MSGTTPAIGIVTPGPLSTIAQALDARLQQAFPTTLFAHDFVPGKITPAVWKYLTRRLPFVGIGWTDLGDGNNRRFFDGKSRWSVILAIKNPSGPGARYFGDALGPGLFSLAEAATVLLHGYTIPEIGSVAVLRVSDVYVDGFADDDMAMCAIDLEVSTAMRVADVLTNIPNTTDWFNTLQIEWNAANWDGSTTVLINDTDTVRTA